MKKNLHYLLLISGMILMNTPVLLKNSYPLSDFTNGLLKGMAIVLLVAFICKVVNDNYEKSQ